MQYDISDARLDELHSKVRKLASASSTRFDELDDQLGELRTALDSLQTTVEHNDRTAREQAEELEDKLGELESDLTDATRMLSRLGDRMGWVERHIRSSGAAVEVDFDEQTAVHAAAVRKVKRGKQAQAQLLGPGERGPLEATVTLWVTQSKRIAELTTAALEASATLTTTSYGDPAHTAAAEAFRAAFKARQDTAKLHQQHRPRADESRTRLAEDDRLRAALAATIEAGLDAANTMRLRLRTTIAEAIGAAALPPVWFTSALGMTPPRGGADAWLDTATDVVTYRITYGITDPVSALGAPPGPGDVDRYRWYRELVDKLRRYDS